jgi:Cytochrome P450
MYPDVQRKAQMELEAVVGSHRLPNAEDIPNLPYIQAIVKEASRWHTVVPLCMRPPIPISVRQFVLIFAVIALPRATVSEDTYKGFRIPAKTVILSNAWWARGLCEKTSSWLEIRAIMHDPEVFEDPMEFKPERYLKNGRINPDVLDPEEAAFGFGRRWV